MNEKFKGCGCALESFGIPEAPFARGTRIDRSQCIAPRLVEALEAVLKSRDLLELGMAQAKAEAALAAAYGEDLNGL